MAVEIGALRALLSLDSSAFERGVRRAEAGMSSMQRRFSRVGRSMQQFGRTMSMRVTAPLVGMAGIAAVSSMRAAEEIERLSQIANASTDEFQRMAAGAQTVGIENDRLADILKDVNDRVGDFIQTGGGPMADFFENIAPQVGVTAEMFRGLSGPDALQLYVSSLEAANLSQEDMVFYMEAMASDATALIPLLANNGAEMERLGDRAARLGAIMDEETIAALTDAQQSLRDVSAAGRGFGNQILSALAPALSSLADTLANVAEWFADLSPETQRFIAISAGIAAAVGPATLALGLFATAIAAISAPVAAVVLGVSALAAGAALIYANWDGVVDFFTGIWGRMESRAREVANGWADVFTAGWALVEAAVTEWPAQALEWGQNLAGRLREGAAERLARLPALFSATWDVVRLAVVGWADEALQWGVGLAQGIATGVGQAVQRIVEAMQRIWTAIVTEVSSWPGRMLEFGGDLIDGLIDGVLSGEGRFTGVLRSLLGRGEDAAREESETRSPSRVFERIGQDIAAGLSLGVANGTAGAVDAVRGMAEQVNGAAVEATGGIGDFASRFASFVSPIIRGTQSIGDAFRSMVDRIANNLLDTGLQGLAQGLFGGLFNGGGGRGLLGLGGFLGFLDGGGRVPAGNWAIAGERGPEIVKGPASVVSRADTARMMGGGGGRMDVRVYVDEDGNWQAKVAQISGGVLREAAPGIVRQSVGAAQSAFRSTKAGWTP